MVIPFRNRINAIIVPMHTMDAEIVESEKKSPFVPSEATSILVSTLGLLRNCSATIMPATTSCTRRYMIIMMRLNPSVDKIPHRLPEHCDI